MQTMQQALVGAGIATTWGARGRLLKWRTMSQAPHLLPSLRSRGGRRRRLKYIGEKQSTAQLGSISIPTIPAVVIYFDRPRHTILDERILDFGL